MRWPRIAVGVMEILVATMIAIGLGAGTDAADWTWRAIGAALVLAGLGCIAGRAWGRWLAVVVAVAFLGLLVTAGAATALGGEVGPAERIRLTAIFGLGLVQWFAVFALLGAWNRAPEALLEAPSERGSGGRGGSERAGVGGSR